MEISFIVVVLNWRDSVIKFGSCFICFNFVDGKKGNQLKILMCQQIVKCNKKLKVGDEFE